jgi:ribosome modulation factor
MMLVSPPESPPQQDDRGTASRGRPLSASFPSLSSMNPFPHLSPPKGRSAQPPVPTDRTPKATDETFPPASTLSKGKATAGFLPKIAIEPGSPLDPDLVAHIRFSRQFEQDDENQPLSARAKPTRVPSQSVGSFETDSSGEYVIPVTATEFGPDWPMELRRELEGLGQQQVEAPPHPSSADEEASQRTPLPDRPDSAVGWQEVTVLRSRPPSEIPTPTPATTLVRSRSPSAASFGVGGDSTLRRVTSSESLSSIGTTYTFSSQAAFPHLPTLASNDVSPRSSVQSNGQQGHSHHSHRQSRTTSLSAPFQPPQPQPTTPPTPTSSRANANPGVSAFVRRADGTIGRPLINVSTAQGTISQRRKIPSPTYDTTTFESSGSVISDAAGRPPLVVPAPFSADAIRSSATAASASESSTEEVIVDEMGRRASATMGQRDSLRNNKPGSAGGLPRTGGGHAFGAGSLPTRLRTLSQPGRRPALPSFVTEAYPPLNLSDLPTPSPSSSEHGSGGGSLPRKTSVPTPTFQHSVMPPSMPPTPSQQVPSSAPFYPSVSVDRSTSPSLHVGVGGGGGGGLPATEIDTPTSAFFPRFAPPGVTAASVPLPPPSMDAVQVVSNPLRRPFQLMRQIRVTIVSGGYLSRRLYIPQNMWTQTGVKLVAIESKVRMIELLITGLEAVEKSGESLLSSRHTLFGRPAMGERMIRELDSFDGLLDGIQSTLAKKLGYIDNVNGKRSGQVNICPFLSVWVRQHWLTDLRGVLELFRFLELKVVKILGQDDEWEKVQFDTFVFPEVRVVRVKADGGPCLLSSLDAPATYVDAISRLCQQAQVLGEHRILSRRGAENDFRLTWVFVDRHLAAVATDDYSAGSSLYPTLPRDVRIAIDHRLRRSSDFFGTVVCRFVMRDISLLCDKYAKRAAQWACE